MGNNSRYDVTNFNLSLAIKKSITFLIYALNNDLDDVNIRTKLTHINI